MFNKTCTDAVGVSYNALISKMLILINGLYQICKALRNYLLTINKDIRYINNPFVISALLESVSASDCLTYLLFVASHKLL